VPDVVNKADALLIRSIRDSTHMHTLLLRTIDAETGSITFSADIQAGEGQSR